jgi:hypothetical protein
MVSSHREAQKQGMDLPSTIFVALVSPTVWINVGGSGADSSALLAR